MKRARQWAIPIALVVLLIWWCFPRSLTPRREAVAGVQISGDLLREAYMYSDDEACIGISNVHMFGTEGLSSGLEALIETSDVNQLLLIRAACE